MATVHPTSRPASTLGYWSGGTIIPADDTAAVRAALARIDEPLFILHTEDGPAIGLGGPPNGDGLPVTGYVPPCLPEALGDETFRRDHGLRYALVSGAMANGIGSEAIVEAMGRAGFLGFFGAAGLSVPRVEQAINRIQQVLGARPHGFNLIHSPNEPDLEAAVVDLYLRRGVRLVEASAYLRLTRPVVRYRVHGIHRGPSGAVICPNRIIAKVSRVEVASKFFAPPPEKLLRELVECGDISPDQAQMAREIPVAQDLTAEADSGGHTDNRPAIALLPTLCALRDRVQEEYAYAVPLRVGLGGGIATPASVVAAFAMGAAYVLTGTINQACVEAGTSDIVRHLLAEAGQADVAMAPAADMFEMGVQVQVLKRGTMFSMRAAKLYELYRAYPALDAIPPPERDKLETTIFRKSLHDVWEDTRRFFEGRDPRQIERAERDPKHKMALVFRWYLGQSSNWANSGDPDRQVDYQVWCGPAMGAFNEWVKGSFLEAPEHRRIVPVSQNLLYGAAVLARAASLRQQAFPLAPEALRVMPYDPDSLRPYFPLS